MRLLSGNHVNISLIVITLLILNQLSPISGSNSSSVSQKQQQSASNSSDEKSASNTKKAANREDVGENQAPARAESKSGEDEHEVEEEQEQAGEANYSRGESAPGNARDAAAGERHVFVIEVLKMLQEQYGKSHGKQNDDVQEKSDRPQFTARQASMNQLLGAIGADGDIRRLIDWAQNSVNLATIGELATQFVVGKLGSINCGAIFSPDKEDTLVPRFLLFNEHFPDVPYELPITPTTNECLVHGHFDPTRKTMILIHGYLTGYTLVDGMTNIKNRLLDLNKLVGEQAMYLFEEAQASNGSYVLTGNLEAAVKQNQFNVIIVDWFNGANPVPRANYIRSAVNAQVVGKLIARFLSALVVRCATPAANLQIIAHSLGCHVAGFTGKAMNSAGHRLGKITHLDPVGLCFGRLFSQPHLRLSPNDALETLAVHVSLNLFDNPLDGTQANFLVNGGRDQIGCGGQSELKNSTTSSVSLLFDSEASFMPCSHLRALALFEDDLSSRPDQCQLVGYRCSNYERFLAGKCGHCDAMNNQCRLMSLPPQIVDFRKMSISANQAADERQREFASQLAVAYVKELYSPELGTRDHNEIRRFDRPAMLDNEQRGRIGQAVSKIKVDARNAIAEGWTSLSGGGSDSARHKATFARLGAKLLFKVMANETDGEEAPAFAQNDKAPAGRFQADNPDVGLVAIPLGGQVPPPGALLGPIYYLGTSSITPFCVNYYQFRVLISESRIQRLLESNSLAPDRSALIKTQNQIPSSAQRSPTTSRNYLHLTVKTLDKFGHFFKGFTIKEDARLLQRVAPDVQIGQQVRSSNPLVEVTLLLNTTRSEPTRISESILSFYFHGIVLADRIEVNYMSNISPEVRARFSSILCPVAINDRHQLIRYVECERVAAAKR